MQEKQKGKGSGRGRDNGQYQRKKEQGCSCREEEGFEKQMQGIDRSSPPRFDPRTNGRFAPLFGRCERSEDGDIYRRHVSREAISQTICPSARTSIW